MSQFDPKPGEARLMRNAKQIGMMEARRELRREKILAEIWDIRSHWVTSEDKLDRLLAVVEELVREPI